MTKQYTMSEVLANRATLAAALRSGDFQQTKEQLAVPQDDYDNAVAEVEAGFAGYRHMWDEGWQAEYDAQIEPIQSPGFCCLGVACEISKSAGVIEKYRPSNAYPPNAVAAWLGLKGIEGSTAIIHRSTHYDKPVFVTLAGLNDTYDFTFAEIADLLDDGQVLISENVLPDPVPTEGCFA